MHAVFLIREGPALAEHNLPEIVLRASRYVDSFIRANGGLRYYGDSQSCTVTMDKAPYYNNVLDSMKFLQSNLPNYVPGGATLDLNALITEITTGSLGFFFGPDPNLDGQMAKTAANKSNPKAPDGVNVRNCIQPTTGWSNGKPLDPKIPPSIKFVSWAGILRGSTAARRCEYQLHQARTQAVGRKRFDRRGSLMSAATGAARRCPRQENEPALAGDQPARAEW